MSDEAVEDDYTNRGQYDVLNRLICNLAPPKIGLR